MVLSHALAATDTNWVWMPTAPEPKPSPLRCNCCHVHALRCHCRNNSLDKIAYLTAPVGEQAAMLISSICILLVVVTLRDDAVYMLYILMRCREVSSNIRPKVPSLGGTSIKPMKAPPVNVSADRSVVCILTPLYTRYANSASFSPSLCDLSWSGMCPSWGEEQREHNAAQLMALPARLSRADINSNCLSIANGAQ